MLSLFKPKISVKTHIGYFQYSQNELQNSVNTSIPYLFITVKNNTNKSILINKICQNVSSYNYIQYNVSSYNYIQYIDINIPQRKLPFTLGPGKSWETWKNIESFSKDHNVFTTITVDAYIDGKLKRYRSKFDKNCPICGPIPDGSY